MGKVSETKDAAGVTITSVHEANKITVGFVRKISLPAAQYKTETVEASLYVQAEVGLEETTEGRTASIKEAFLLAKSAVCEQLGLKFEIDANLVVQEIIEKHFGAVGTGATEQQAEATTPVSRSAQSAGNAPKSKADLWNDLQNNPKGWFDNRTNKTKATSPDFKRKQTGEGLWITGKYGNEAEKHNVTLPDASAF